MGLRGVSTAAALLICAALCGACAALSGRQDAPDGSTPTLEQLKAGLDAEFARLGIEPDKVAAKAPSGSGNFVFDLASSVLDPDGAGPGPPTMIVLNWAERALGDYDQNGEVNIGDLTPLGQKFHATVGYASALWPISWWPQGLPTDDGGAGAGNPPAAGSGAENWRLARIDGDENGELNISDLTPLAAHWGERVAGYQVWRRDPGQPVFHILLNPGDPLAAMSVSRPVPDPARPLVYAFVDTPISPGIYEYYVAPYDVTSLAEGLPSNHIAVNFVSGGGPVNQPPTAVLSCTPNSGDAPLYVTWDASLSYDPDGTGVTYEWDIDGDGTYDAGGGTDSSIAQSYGSGGTYAVGVRVTDALGAQAATVGTINVGYGGAGNLPPVAVLVANPASGQLPLNVTWDASGSSDPNNNIAEYHWDADEDGFPEITTLTPEIHKVYVDTGIHTCTVCIWDTATLASNIASATVDVQPASGSYWHTYKLSELSYPTSIHLEVIGSNPAIAYWNDLRERTCYLSAADGLGLTWGTTTEATDYGVVAALAEADGRPAMALTHQVMGEMGGLHYTRASDAGGSSWAEGILALDNTATVQASECDMAIVNGNPAVAYYVVNKSGLWYTRAVDATGTVWINPVDIPGTRSPILVVIGGRPAILSAYASVQYSRAANANGDTAQAWILGDAIHTSVAVGGFPGQNICFAVIGALPALVSDHTDPAGTGYVRASDPNGAAWEAPVDLDTSMSGAKHTVAGLVELAGKPAIFYNDSDAFELMFLRGNDAATFAPGMPEDIDIGGTSACAVVSGAPAVAYNNYNDLMYAVYF